MGFIRQERLRVARCRAPDALSNAGVRGLASSTPRIPVAILLGGRKCEFLMRPEPVICFD